MTLCLSGPSSFCVDTDDYQTFNRDNVALGDVKKSPIVEITAYGLRTADAEYPLDVTVFATGSLLAVDIRGVGGQSLRKKWAHGPRTHLGFSVAGFPNLFIIAVAWAVHRCSATRRIRSRRTSTG